MSEAALIGDPHLCKKAEGSKPHVGGPILGPPDASRPLVGGRPISLVGDNILCIGPPDKVVQGIEHVLVAGKPVTDSSASTDHGGTIQPSGSLNFG